MECKMRDKQSQLIKRIQADFLKEGNKHRRDGRDLAAVDCEEQAHALNGVLESLDTLNQCVSALYALGSIPIDLGFDYVPEV